MDTTLHGDSLLLDPAYKEYRPGLVGAAVDRAIRASKYSNVLNHISSPIPSSTKMRRHTARAAENPQRENCSNSLKLLP